MKKITVASLHLGYWLLYCLLLFSMLLIVSTHDYGKQAGLALLVHFLLFSPFFMLILGSSALGFYSFYMIVFPWYLKQQKILLTILVGMSISLLSAIVPEILVVLWKGEKTLFNDGWNSAIGITVAISGLAFVNGVIALILKGFKTWYDEIKLKEDLSSRNYEMEIALMKAQISPHFLFNTINNIDILIEKNPVKASAYLNKLSDIMRFMLYETKAEKILLEKELDYIQQYVELQKIRTPYPERITYSVQGRQAGIMIAPMLFIPYIENAFKHIASINGESVLHIEINIERNAIKFQCINTYTVNSRRDYAASGLGNELIKTRLNLLYPGKHTIEIVDANGLYSVNLLLSF